VSQRLVVIRDSIQSCLFLLLQLRELLEGHGVQVNQSVIEREFDDSGKAWGMDGALAGERCTALVDLMRES
jgi:hypothetical protein